MDGAVLGLFLIGAFLGGVTNGLSGFAMGLVVSGIWLQFLTPVENATLIIGYSIVMQTYGTWRLRHALKWRQVLPFIIGGVIGIPIGTALLHYTNPLYVRTGIGVLLVLYSINGLARPHLKPVKSGPPVDVGIGILNGLVAGLTGLAGVVVSVWCQLRGWHKDVQRTVFQPTIVTMSAMTMVSFAVSGTVTIDIVKLFLYGLPPLLAGLWLGFKLYGKLDDAAFRKMILWLLLFCGFALIVPMSMFR